MRGRRRGKPRLSGGSRGALVLQPSLIGGAGVAALPLLVLVGSITRTGLQLT